MPEADVSFPPNEADFAKVAAYLSGYDEHWNATTVQTLVDSFPASSYASEAYRLVRLGTELIFRCGTRATLRALADRGHSVYEYSFNYRFTGYVDPKSALCEATAELLCGVYHASELRFVFDTLQLPLDAPDHRVAATMGAYWTNFAKRGDPNGPGLVEWPRFNRSVDAHLELNDPPVARTGLAERACDLLDSIEGRA